MTMPTRLVTFLGTGSYNEAVYYGSFDDTEFEQRTPYVARALAQAVGATEIVVLETEQASRKHGESLRRALREARLPAPLAWDCIPTGAQRSDLWSLFDSMKRALRVPSGVRVVLDITHAFRALPFFGGAVIPFLRAVDPDVAPIRVAYGAYEAGLAQKQANDDIVRAPVWDLTSFVEVVEWALALQLFLRTGRAAEVAEPTRRLGNALRREWAAGGRIGTQPRLEELGKALASYGDDLVTVRTGALLLGSTSAAGSAVAASLAVEAARETARQHLPPLADVLDRVQQMLDPLKVGTSTLNGPEGQRALVALASIYRDMGRIAEALATVREAFVTLQAWDGAAQPGSLRCRLEGRARADQRFFRSDERRHKELGALRNDVMHAGYRTDPAPPKTILAKLDEHLEALRTLVPTPERTCLVNISNHPIATWNGKQRDAALRYADEIQDLPFPPISPSEKDVAMQVESCLAGLPANASHAMVQGEAIASVEIVARLQARGITCLASTTDRKVQDHGDGRRTTQFEFVAFRPYPSIRLAGA